MIMGTTTIMNTRAIKMAPIATIMEHAVTDTPMPPALHPRLQPVVAVKNIATVRNLTSYLILHAFVDSH
jgi:hypothetical protein